MSSQKKNPTADDLIDSLLDDVKDLYEHSGPFTQSDIIIENSLLDIDLQALTNPAESLATLAKPQLKSQPQTVERTHLQAIPSSLELDKTIAMGANPSATDAMSDFAALDLKPPAHPKSQRSGFGSTEERTELSNNNRSPQQTFSSSTTSDKDRTLAVEGFAKSSAPRVAPVKARDSIGKMGEAGVFRSGNAYINPDASLIQSENLRLAQHRIAELEKENDLLRQENEELFSAGEVIRGKTDELNAKVFHLEQEKNELEESFHKEVLILRGSLQFKESEVSKSKNKIQELEARLKSDFKKIRVRERELENRLELSKAEKAALVRAKDENILELKRKIDHLETELDNYKSRCLDLNRNVETQQEQFKKTVKALRLALTNLESKEAGTYKKAE